MTKKVGAVGKIGMIGVGHLAGYMVDGFYNIHSTVEGDFNVILSPRNAKKSEELSKKYGCIIAKDNQSVVDRSDVIIISVKPKDVIVVLKDLQFRKGQVIISVAAGVSRSDVLEFSGEADVVLALPLSSTAINQSPTLMHPQNEKAAKVLELLGLVNCCEYEEQFQTACSYSAFYGWCFKFLEEMTAWGVNSGLSEDISRSMVTKILSNTAEMAALDPDRSLSDIVTSLATKGGITELGLLKFEKNSAFDVWHEAMDDVRKRLAPKE